MEGSGGGGRASRGIRLDGYREKPLPNESKESRVKHAVIYKKVNVLTPYTKVGEIWDVPPSTIQRHVTKKMKPRGGQPVFTKQQEDMFAKHLLRCADALWPVSTAQLKDYIQRFCVHYRVRAVRFKNGRPGKDWVAGFLSRHPQLKVRRAAAISAAKAWGTSPAKLKEYFERLRPLLATDGDEYCSPECVLNYDETAITDDAGNPKVITRRSSKSPRAVLNNNKTSRSVMFAVTADGECLPPYVCTKTKFKEDELDGFGPPLCYWDTSKSGWFNMCVFDNWFEAVVAPWAISHQGKHKVVLGDNLSSHLSPVSLKRAEELGVHFRLLPPNTTHFLQPLDVAFFGPLKRAWRDQLLTYKRIHLNKSLLKRHFAGEFKKLLATIKPDTIKSGFKATGLVPFDPEQAVSRMPASVHPVLDESGSVLAEALGLNQDQRALPTRPQRKDQAPPGSELASSSLPPPPPPPPVQQNHPAQPQHVSSAQGQQLPEKSPKKKRGRPAKATAPIADAELSISAPQKKRGRPAKAKVPNADSEPSTSAPKKKRGRPRKTAVQASNPATSSPKKKRRGRPKKNNI